MRGDKRRTYRVRVSIPLPTPADPHDPHWRVRMDREIARGSILYDSIAFRESATRVYAEGIISVEWQRWKSKPLEGQGGVIAGAVQSLGFLLRHTNSAEFEDTERGPWPIGLIRATVDEIPERAS